MTSLRIKVLFSRFFYSLIRRLKCGLGFWLIDGICFLRWISFEFQSEISFNCIMVCKTILKYFSCFGTEKPNLATPSREFFTFRSQKSLTKSVWKEFHCTRVSRWAQLSMKSCCCCLLLTFCAFYYAFSALFPHERNTYKFEVREKLKTRISLHYLVATCNTEVSMIDVGSDFLALHNLQNLRLFLHFHSAKDWCILRFVRWRNHRRRWEEEAQFSLFSNH